MGQWEAVAPLAEETGPTRPLYGGLQWLWEEEQVAQSP
jgi:hypothetical protein